MDYFLKTKEDKHFIEHHQYYFADEKIDCSNWSNKPSPILFKEQEDSICFKIDYTGKPIANYFVGIDWLIEKEKAVYVQPKLNRDTAHQTDYLKMLLLILEDTELANYTDELYEIKWDKSVIEINKKQDILTPLIVVQYLQLVKKIVSKGLKKSYYSVEQNLYGKVKGKVLVSKTIKKNVSQNKFLNTWCSYSEYGINGVENRLLKKAMIFILRYTNSIGYLKDNGYLNNSINYIMSAFENVSSEVELHEVKQGKVNAFYKEYELALKLARLIMRKFGYNINSIEDKDQINTPPFWIDMSKLYELYVYGILKKKYISSITYQDKGKYGFTDFLLNIPNKKMILDAKYKTKYQQEQYKIEDIRQLSGYARDFGVLIKLKIPLSEWKVLVPECVIIYPSEEFLKDKEEPEIDLENLEDIKGFVNFKKISVKLPVIKMEG